MDMFGFDLSCKNRATNEPWFHLHWHILWNIS